MSHLKLGLLMFELAQSSVNQRAKEIFYHAYPSGKWLHEEICLPDRKIYGSQTIETWLFFSPGRVGAWLRNAALYMFFMILLRG